MQGTREDASKSIKASALVVSGDELGDVKDQRSRSVASFDGLTSGVVRRTSIEHGGAVLLGFQRAGQVIDDEITEHRASGDEVVEHFADQIAGGQSLELLDQGVGAGGWEETQLAHQVGEALGLVFLVDASGDNVLQWSEHKLHKGSFQLAAVVGHGTIEELVGGGIEVPIAEQLGAEASRIFILNVHARKGVEGEGPALES